MEKQKQNKEKTNMEKNAGVKRVEASPALGLTREQVEERMKAHADNGRVKAATRSVSDIVKSNVFTYFNLIFAVFAVLLFLTGAWSDMIFLPVILANTGIGIVQEIHSKRVLDRLKLLQAPKTKAVRDGKIKELDSEELVLDDIIILEAGNRIPADAAVVDGGVWVNESLLTGESDEIEKKAGDHLLSGSYVVSGKAAARLEQVGKEAYISHLILEATTEKDSEQSEMIRSLNDLLLVLGILMIPIGTALFVQSYVFNKAGLRDSITGMVAAVIGMIPEGLYLLSSVAMAVSTMRLAKNKVLVHDMKCIETLARVDVLCIDKTGTITEAGMQVYEICAFLQEEKEAVEKKLAAFVEGMEKENETIAALKAYFDGVQSPKENGQRIGKVYPFSPETKYSAAVLDGVPYVLGAPELILREQYANYRETVEAYSGQGYRVLLFAEYQGILNGKKLTDAVLPKAVVMLSNPIRKGAPETFAFFKERGVEIKVISGDHPLTVSVIAQKAGIAHAKRYVDASAFSDDEELKAAAFDYTVFGRVTPKQKKLLVQALQNKKKTVAMTGDGVNDVLALKEANCSIAMASGSDAASNVSQMVLLDSDFSKMPSVAAEGRRVVNNIERTASLYLVKNIFSMLLAIFSVLLMWNYPLEPSQVSLISMFTIGIPSFILALEPNQAPIRGHFLTNVMLKALPAGLTDFIVVSGLVFFCREFQVDLECLSTSCTVLVAVVGFMILYRIAKPMNRLHIAMMAVLVAGLLFCMTGVSRFFGITGISRQCAMLMVVFAVITEPVLRYLSLLFEKIHKELTKMSKQKENCCNTRTNRL